jgi:hypothetical protein
MPRMQRIRAIPVASLGSGSRQTGPRAEYQLLLLLLLLLVVVVVVIVVLLCYNEVLPAFGRW